VRHATNKIYHYPSTYAKGNKRIPRRFAPAYGGIRAGDVEFHLFKAHAPYEIGLSLRLYSPRTSDVIEIIIIFVNATDLAPR
jgi:hypothetical protein